MTKTNITIDLKYKIGEKVYYCPTISDSESIIYEAEIIEASIKYSNIQISIDYVITFNKNLGHLASAHVSGSELYGSKIDIIGLERIRKKRKIENRIMSYKKIIKNKESEIQKLKDEFDEIVKEELIIGISGIGSKK